MNIRTVPFIAFGFAIGFVVGICWVEGKSYKRGALAQKNGEITWHTNAVTNVSFTKNK